MEGGVGLQGPGWGQAPAWGMEPEPRGFRPRAALTACPGGAWSGRLVGAPGLQASLACCVLLPQLLARDLRGEMTLPTGAERRPSLSCSALGWGVAQLLTLSQVLPSVWGCVHGGLRGGSPLDTLGTGHGRHHSSVSRRLPGVAWFRAQWRAWVRSRDDLRELSIQAGGSTWGAAETVEWSLCSTWTADRMWPHHQGGM